jgi:hypothetical protein
VIDAWIGSSAEVRRKHYHAVRSGDGRRRKFCLNARPSFPSCAAIWAAPLPKLSQRVELAAGLIPFAAFGLRVFAVLTAVALTKPGRGDPDR